jgi:hypothetical protein
MKGSPGNVRKPDSVCADSVPTVPELNPELSVKNADTVQVGSHGVPGEQARNGAAVAPGAADDNRSDGPERRKLCWSPPKFAVPVNGMASAWAKTGDKERSIRRTLADLEPDFLIGVFLRVDPTFRIVFASRVRSPVGWSR